MSTEVLNLRTEGSFGQYNGAYFSTTATFKSSPGIFDPFLVMNLPSSQPGTEIGYNTDAALTGANGVNQQEDTDMQPGTDSVLLSAIPITYIQGVAYREIRIGINQEGTDSLLSFDGLKVFLGNAPNLRNYFPNGNTNPGGDIPDPDPATTGSGITTASFYNNTVKVWDLDTGSSGNAWISLDYNAYGSGTANGDLSFLIPDSVFQAANPIANPYLYVYSSFGRQGGDWVANDGFENFGRGTQGAFASSDIKGFKFIDTNGDGVQQLTELPLAGVVIELLDENGNPVDTDPLTAGIQNTTTTNALGYYFRGRPKG